MSDETIEEPAAAREQLPEQREETQPPKKKNKTLRVMAWVLGIVLGIPLFTLIVLLCIAVVSRAEPSAYVPGGFTLYASLPKVGTFVREAIDLKAVDELLSEPDMGDLRALVRSIRGNSFLRSKAFEMLANMRIDAAMYADGNFVAVALLGYRSALIKILPLIQKFAPGWTAFVNGLAYAESGTPHYTYTNGDATLYIAPFRNLLIIASSEDLLLDAMEPEPNGIAPETAAALKTQNTDFLRVLVNPSAFLGGIQSDMVTKLIGAMDIPPLGVVDISIKNDNIALAIDVPASMRDAQSALAQIMQRRSKTPAILARLPESVTYYTLLSAGRIQSVWQAVEPFADAEIRDAYKTADKAAKYFFNMGIDTLLFSWMGDEAGILGGTLGAEPVFFASISDEKTRRAVFEKAFSSEVISRNSSALVGDTRVPRIVFPAFIRGFLALLGIHVIEPFYIVRDGYVYISQSAELLVAMLTEAEEGRLLVKSGRWQSNDISPESSFSMYYSTDRGIPFFMRGQSGLHKALRLYGRGVALLRFKKGAMRLELSASPLAGSAGPRELSGFPIKAGGRIASPLVCVQTSKGVPMAYWVSGNSVHALNLASGTRSALDMDATGYIAADVQKKRLRSLWAVSERGTVYRLDAELEALSGFPVMTGRTVSGPPAVSGESCLIPVTDEPSIMFVNADAVQTFSVSLGAKTRARPAVSKNGIAVLPRSFESELYFLDHDGACKEGWPIGLDGIAQAEPVFAGENDAYICALTESGNLYLYLQDGIIQSGFPVTLEGNYDCTPVWSNTWRALFAISVEGKLLRIGLNGIVQGETVLPRGRARGSKLGLYDTDGDGREEIFVSGGGDALYAFEGDFTPLAGYPVSGAGIPSFTEINGDGVIDMVVEGADDTIHAYGVFRY